MTYPHSPQWRGTRFENPPDWPRRPGLGGFVCLQLGGRPKADPAFRPPTAAAEVARLAEDAQSPSVTWIGHATLLCQAGGARVITDPIFVERLGLIRRWAPPGLALEQLPDVDVCLISHNHRDHLDAYSVKALGRQGQRRGRPVTFVVPLGLAAWFERAGLSPVVELDWWQSTRIRTAGGADLEVTLVPAQHWSQRSLGDVNQSLWGGFVFRAGRGSRAASYYFAGDTGYPAAFAEIGRRMGRIDYALLPIGAYEPRWFMRSQHMGPDEAARAFADLGAGWLLPMHWGTFRLTDEPMHEPPELLSKAMAGQKERIIELPIGGTHWALGSG